MTDSATSDAPPKESTDLQISPADLALASELAQKKDMDVEIYLKTLIHDELTRQANFQPTDESRAEGPI